MRVVSEKLESSGKIEIGDGYTLKMLVKVDNDTILVLKTKENDEEGKNTFCLHDQNLKEISCVESSSDYYKKYVKYSEGNIMYPKCSKLKESYFCILTLLNSKYDDEVESFDIEVIKFPMKGKEGG